MDKKTVEHFEFLIAENARLRNALMNVMMMLSHNRDPNECAKWIEEVLSLDLTDGDLVDDNEFYSFAPNKEEA